MDRDGAVPERTDSGTGDTARRILPAVRDDRFTPRLDPDRVEHSSGTRMTKFVVPDVAAVIAVAVPTRVALEWCSAQSVPNSGDTADREVVGPWAIEGGEVNRITL